MNPVDLEHRRIDGVRHVVYRSGGLPDEPSGPLELTFDDGVVVSLSLGRTGSDLVIAEGPWTGYGADPPSWTEFGHWTMVDDSEAASALAGAEVAVAHEVARHGVLVGAVLRTSKGDFLIDAAGDDIRVTPV